MNCTDQERAAPTLPATESAQASEEVGSAAFSADSAADSSSNSSACAVAEEENAAPMPSAHSSEGSPTEEMNRGDCSEGQREEGFSEEDSTESGETASETDYAQMAEEDGESLRALFPDLGIESLCDLDDPRRFAELREMGLSVSEAFYASNHEMLGREKRPPASIEERRAAKSHLRGTLPTVRTGRGTMPRSILKGARALFEGMSDAELHALYKRVTEPKN